MTGQPRKYVEGERVASAYRIPIDLRDRLQAEADRRCISRNLIIERAIIEWLDRAEVQTPAELLATRERQNKVPA